jgi:hypothetical protein
VGDEFGRETVDGAQETPQDVDLAQDTFDQGFCFRKLDTAHGNKHAREPLAVCRHQRKTDLTRQRSARGMTQAGFSSIWQLQIERPGEGERQKLSSRWRSKIRHYCA